MICPQLASDGVCVDHSCSFNHDVRICEPCGVIADSTHNFEAHLAGKRHRRKVQGLGRVLHCTICQRVISGLNQWNQHIAGRPHRRQAALHGVSDDVVPEAADGDHAGLGQMYCATCNTFVLRKSWTAHIAGRRHSSMEQCCAFKSALEEAEKDKHGVVVSGNTDFGIIDVNEAEAEIYTQLDIENTVPSCRISIVEVKLASNMTRNPSPG